MSLPRISPSKSPNFGTLNNDEEISVLFKRYEDLKSIESSETRTLGADVVTMTPKRMTGYTGFQPSQEGQAQSPKVISAPVVGYTGYYRGRNIGKLGRTEIHKARVSAWERETVSNILGVPYSTDEWEYSHYTNSCRNFSDKRFHEATDSVSPSSLNSSGSLSVRSPNDDDNRFASQGRRSPVTGVLESESFLCSRMLEDDSSHSLDAAKSYVVKQFLAHQLGEQTDLDLILQYVQKCLESRFKTALAARSGLKAAFAAEDKFRTGKVKARYFINALETLAGVHLTDIQSECLCGAFSVSPVPTEKTVNAMPKAGLQRKNSSKPIFEPVENALASKFPHIPEDAEVSYGRFLNVVVPRQSTGAERPETSEAYHC